jgi:hypothetical protein
MAYYRMRRCAGCGDLVGLPRGRTGCYQCGAHPKTCTPRVTNQTAEAINEGIYSRHVRTPEEEHASTVAFRDMLKSMGLDYDAPMEEIGRLRG